MPTVTINKIYGGKPVIHLRRVTLFVDQKAIPPDDCNYCETHTEVDRVNEVTVRTALELATALGCKIVLNNYSGDKLASWSTMEVVDDFRRLTGFHSNLLEDK